MNRPLQILFLLSSSLTLLSASPWPAKEAHPYAVKQIHSGHSLTDPLFGQPWPGQYVDLMTNHFDAPFDHIAKSTIPGSPMHWRWEHSTQPDARHDIEDFELLVITEGVPFPNWEKDYPHDIRGSIDYLSRFHANAWEHGNGGQGAATLLWTTWTNIDGRDGDFREMLDTYDPLWERMAREASLKNEAIGAPPIYLVPGHRMMARLYDDIQAKRVPGVTELSDFFSDTIHLATPAGKYATALIHYACIYHKSPVGLPNTLNGESVPPALAAYLQRMIWDVVTSYPPTGVVGDA